MSLLDFFKKKPADTSKPKTLWQAWGDPILFAVVAATIIRWMLLEAFTIPTTSMESSLMAGDFLFVSKMHYGPRTPMTPLQLPLTHQTVPVLGFQSYSTLIQLPMKRLWGFSEVTAGDAVVFNFPGDLQYPVDLRTNYIKRCVAVAGDTVQVFNRELLVNGKPFINPERLQHGYLINTNERISKEIWSDLDVTEYYNLSDHFSGNEEFQSPVPGVQNEILKLYQQNNLPVGTGYFAFLNDEMVSKLSKIEGVKSVLPIIHENNGGAFPYNEKFKWSVDFFGKLWIPKEGATIPMTEDNLILYGSTIVNYDDVGHTKIENGVLFVNGSPVKEYTFKQDYYWMMGDNRHNSSDSRFFGFVPADHIVGKAVFVWMAVNRSPKNNKSVRWSRMMRTIN